MSKKGGVRDFIVIPIFILTFGIISILAYFFYTQFTGAMTTAGIYTGAVATTGAAFGGILLLFDKLLALIMILLIVALAYSNYRIASEPGFFAVILILAPVFGLVSFYFNYVFSQLMSQSVINATALLFPATLALCTNLHWIALLSVVVGSVTLWAKKRSDGEVTG